MLYQINKRIIDIFVSFICLIILAPILLLLQISVHIFIGKPILFIDNRPGIKNKLFSLYKFRTMTNTKNSYGELLPDRDRITPLGKFLRNSSLDELPSLWNVLKGDMSLVGPRPLLIEYLSMYTPNQARRHDVKPGITGWAQINGRNAISWEEKFKLDVWYVDNQSMWLDIKILIRTVWKVLISEGISHTGHVTMEKFNGNN